MEFLGLLLLLFTNLKIGEIRKLEEDERKKEKAKKMHRRILEWLSPDDFEHTHERHFKKRFGNTGQWLLDDARFTNWRDETQSSLLWCHGARKLSLNTRICAYINLYIVAGSGKTVLAYGHYILIPIKSIAG